jgi:hypothetical protein
MNAVRNQTLISRRAAAKLLAVTTPTLDNLAKFHGLTIRQVPGHNRKHFLRAEIEALAARAEHVATGARA